ncbi:hypothetical protein GMLC_26210 [Geomonas limicola]|uniref:Fibronectin type-III domain-containing protein n=1 Tax=Geomonas limicola TaxID=2740186 RepID=A0A6V8N8X7_9BACT|nr:fibronectin type III domain-containing protein [Geomonas limicola]GFO69042.1 hypothetical protein GMLC_26210 [Geomonas limicola]
MKHGGKIIAQILILVLLALGLGGCGASPWRFDPGVPAPPATVVATAGNGVVRVSWSQLSNATGYDVYFASSPGVSTSSSSMLNLGGSFADVTGLQNGTPYYFRVVAHNSKGSSPLSNEVSATPSPAGIFLSTDLVGTWRFNALVSGAGAKWMRGSVTIDALGVVTVGSYLDSAGGTTAPAELFSTMSILPDGIVSQDGAAAGFHGTLSENIYRDLLVGAGTTTSGQLTVVLQKVVPGISFASTDIQGTGQSGAGPLLMVYHQLSSGAVGEWEWGAFQVGRDQAETYSAIAAQSAKLLPGAGSKVVGMTISADGLVSEAPKAGVTPQPAALLTDAVMSADKMTIVGTATDNQGAYLLRIIQLVHPPTVALTATSYQLADLAGSYTYLAALGGTNPGWALATETVGSVGNASFTGYLTSEGSTTAPAPFALGLDAQGKVTSGADTTFHGQFSYAKDLVVATGTGAGGAGYLSISVKRNN